MAAGAALAAEQQAVLDTRLSLDYMKVGGLSFVRLHIHVYISNVFEVSFLHAAVAGLHEGEGPFLLFPKALKL